MKSALELRLVSAVAAQALQDKANEDLDRLMENAAKCGEYFIDRTYNFVDILPSEKYLSELKTLGYKVSSNLKSRVIKVSWHPEDSK